MSRADLNGLKAFRSEYPEADTALLYRGADRKRVDSIWCIPVAEFLPGIKPDSPIRFA